MTLSRRIVAECLGTTFLLAAVVGSGIMAEKLANGNIAIALLANTVVTGATYADDPDFHIWANLWRTLQPCGNACRCLAGWD